MKVLILLFVGTLLSFSSSQACENLAGTYSCGKVGKVTISVSGTKIETQFGNKPNVVNADENVYTNNHKTDRYSYKCTSSNKLQGDHEWLRNNEVYAYQQKIAQVFGNTLIIQKVRTKTDGSIVKNDTMICERS